MTKKYKEQAGDTTMDEAIGLLDEARDLLEMDNRPETESWLERVENFIGDNQRQ